jgi:hypothetical protein
MLLEWWLCNTKISDWKPSRFILPRDDRRRGRRRRQWSRLGITLDETEEINNQYHNKREKRRMNEAPRVT